MSIANDTSAPPRTPSVTPISPEELRQRNARTIAMLDLWVAEGDEQEQREAMDVLREALGPNRTLSHRSVFKP